MAPIGVLGSLLVLTFGLLTATQVSSHAGGTDEFGCHRDGRTQEHHCHKNAKSQTNSGVMNSSAREPGYGEYRGVLSSVVDGDGLYALIDGRRIEIRLADIDSPEWDQEYGHESKRELDRLVSGVSLDLKCRGRDRYKRWLCRVSAHGIDVNRELVARGASWVSEQYSQDPDLKSVELTARTARRGLWGKSSARPVPPWEWKQRRYGR